VTFFFLWCFYSKVLPFPLSLITPSRGGGPQFCPFEPSYAGEAFTFLNFVFSFHSLPSGAGFLAGQPLSLLNVFPSPLVNDRFRLFRCFLFGFFTVRSSSGPPSLFFFFYFVPPPFIRGVLPRGWAHLVHGAPSFNWGFWFVNDFSVKYFGLTISELRVKEPSIPCPLSPI